MRNSNTSSRQLAKAVSTALDMAHNVLTDDNGLVAKWLHGNVTSMSKIINSNSSFDGLSNCLNQSGASVEIEYGKTSCEQYFVISIRDLISGDPFDNTHTMSLCTKLMNKANNTIGLVGVVTSDDPTVTTTLWIPSKDFIRVSRIIKDVIGDTFVISDAPLHMTVTDNNYSLKLRFEVERRA